MLTVAPRAGTPERFSRAASGAGSTVRDFKRYNECKDKLVPYLRKCGFNPKTELTFMPCSGLTGAYLKEVAPPDVCPWYRGPPFLVYIDSLAPLSRSADGPFRMPAVDKYKQLLLMPNRRTVEVLQLWSDEDETNLITSGENVKVKLKGVEEEEVSPGFVLCDVVNQCKVAKVFDAQVVILEHKSIICPGYSAVLHIHAAIEECSVKTIICLVDRKSGEKSKTRPRFVKQDQIAIMRMECAGVVCMEPFKEFPQMGRFTLRDEVSCPLNFLASELDCVFPYDCKVAPLPSGRCCGWWNDWEQPRSSATLPARSRHHHPGIASSSKAPPAPPTHLATANNGTARGAHEASTAGPNARFEPLRRRPQADDRGPHGGAPSAVGSGLELGPNQSARVIRRGSLQHHCIVVPRCISSLGM
ncbi:hypothetical protein HPB51_008828 [Rhipicephalus microplus]|uniref:GTP-eEF1A C-terminal domain-containing protein n=1 Tax=Rhipicephalus microplus TaxID=6941 RepID=A0A9J6ERW3_RHIMP|nr:hypothetical protein HPB51_008828 [Rhipicephalus microplus]